MPGFLEPEWHWLCHEEARSELEIQFCHFISKIAFSSLIMLWLFTLIYSFQGGFCWIGEEVMASLCHWAPAAVLWWVPRGGAHRFGEHHTSRTIKCTLHLSGQALRISFLSTHYQWRVCVGMGGLPEIANELISFCNCASWTEKFVALLPSQADSTPQGALLRVPPHTPTHVLFLSIPIQNFNSTTVEGNTC